MNPILPLGSKILTGRIVALEPLEERHHGDLIRAAADPAIWTYIPLDMSKGFAARLGGVVEEMAKGTQLTFAVRRLSDGTVVGSTSYLAITPKDAKVEIGATWYVAGAQGTAVNPEAKYLLLENAFAAGYNRVEFKTDSKNARSRAALKKLGAVEEGILRGHMWMPQGYFRDSVYFSILAAEWPRVKDALERRLAA
ncbi:MAG: GNAT family N-acetyltransferase [Alphaproteobacteria bacterium]|nr:GNAT family N-acetyltransferase [Alphaproteobacteria bacterium]MDE2111594.1 GNAT family N-acetyltransferase [Alphaproteobacteria bacterium]MDE2495734.1 GNAT family N-acetyltransferase [Alphaproteobacteria bacterium]